MSVEVDDVWLYETVLNYLKTREQQEQQLLLPQLFARQSSPHFVNGDRNILSHWIYRLVRVFKTGCEAQHLAIYLFDGFITEHQADIQGLYLIGAACFSLSCKVVDVEINTPQPSKILKQVPFENTLQCSMLKSTELLVLQHFNWSLLRPTAASFLEYYSSSCLAVEMEHIHDEVQLNTFTKMYNKWTTCFREITLFNNEFQHFLPSKLASSIVVATRMSIGMQPSWPEYMVQLTGYLLSDIGDIVYRLRRHMEINLSHQQNYEPFPVANNNLATTSTIPYNTGLVFDTIPQHILHQNKPNICFTKVHNGASSSGQSLTCLSTLNSQPSLPMPTFHRPVSSGDGANYNESHSFVPMYQNNNAGLCRPILDNPASQQYQSVPSTSFLSQLLGPDKQPEYFNNRLYCLKTNPYLNVYSQPSSSVGMNVPVSTMYTNTQLPYYNSGYMNQSFNNNPMYYSQPQYYYNYQQPPPNQGTSLLQEIASCHDTPTSQSLAGSQSSSRYVLVPSSERCCIQNMYSNSVSLKTDNAPNQSEPAGTHISNRTLTTTSIVTSTSLVVNMSSNKVSSKSIYSTENCQPSSCHYPINPPLND